MRILLYPVLAFSCLGASLTASKPLALAFEARDGRYVSHGPGYSLSVTSTEAVLSVAGHSLRMRLAGAGLQAALEPLDRMPGRVNYIRGGDAARSYQLYGRVRSRGVYPGIDMLFHGNQERLEYDFEIAAGRDPENIRLDFESVDGMRIDPTGDLVLRSGKIEIRQPVPVAYQISRGKRVEVSAAYRIDASNQVHFQLGPYDHAVPLTIDPQLVFDNAFGGSGVSSAADVALDSSGNIYVAGQTNSADFPTQHAEQGQPGGSALVATSDVEGPITWMSVAVPANAIRSIASSPASHFTFYAATNAGVITSTDNGATWTAPANAGLTVAPVAIAVDAGSAMTVYAATQGQGVFTSTNGGASWTQSTNGLIVPNSTPPSAPEFTGIFANPSIPGTVFAISQAPDFVYRSTDFGQTWSQVNLPEEGGSPQALAFTNTNPSTLILGQYSGSLLSSSDNGNTWTTLSNQNVYGPQGLAISPSIPSILLGAAAQTVSRSADGGQTWTSVLALSFGSVAFDPKSFGVAYALNSSGLYMSSDSGQSWSKTALAYTQSADALFISPENSQVFVGEESQADAFVTKYSPDGSQILYSTYLGGNANDSATGIAVDSAGSAYVFGVTQSSNFPVSSNPYQGALAGNVAGSQDAFVSKLSADGSQLVYSTFLGGGAEQSSRIAVDSAGEAVVAGSTSSANFPVTAGAAQSALNTNCNPQAPLAVPNAVGAFVTKISSSGASLVFSTLLGGSCQTNGQSIALDSNGNVWTAGSTTSPDFPVTKDALQPASGGGIYDGFLARFTSSGSLAYATYIGGPGYDSIAGIAFDKTGNLYITGTSGGLQQPASPGVFETQAGTDCPIFGIGPETYQFLGSAFVLKLDSAAHNHLGLTYLGYPLCLFPSDIAVDSSGEPWIGGTFSPAGSAPQTASPFQIGIGNGFVSKFSADFTQLLFSTYFNAVFGLTLDGSGFAYAAGAGPLNNAQNTQQAYVAKIDSAPPAISLDSVQNAVNSASPDNAQGIGPGEYLRLLGKHLGPAAPAAGIIKGGVVSTGDAGVEVTFDGVAVPLLAVSATEIDLMAPFELAGKSVTTVQVQYQGVPSNAVQVSVSGVPLQVLGIFNAGFTVNSAANPAEAGSIMTLYIAGVGQTNPASVDGQVNSFPLASAPAPVQIVVPGNTPSGSQTTLPVTFAGAAPGLAAGIFQINFVAPQQGPLAVILTVGSASAGLNLFVQ